MKDYKVILPLYPYRMQVSKQQRPIYYTIEHHGIMPPSKIKKKMIKDVELYIKERYLTINNLNYPYAFGIYKANKLQGILLESDSYMINRLSRDFCIDIKVVDVETLEPLLANPSQAGNARYVYINGQILYSQAGGQFVRQKMMDFVKEFIAKYAANVPLILEYPISVHYELFDTIKAFHDNTKEGDGRRWDVYNRISPYMKAFPDFLTNGWGKIAPKIVDDDRLHLIGESYHFTPIDNHENRSIQITIKYNG